MIQLRPYQEEAIEKAYPIIATHRIIYLNMEVRTGKTITSFALANKLLGHVRNCRIMFITTKKAIDMGGIQEDFDSMRIPFQLELVSMDSLHKVNASINYYDVIIADESHLIGGAFPKPSNRADNLKAMFQRNKYAFYIMLSGTPHPESKAQLFHQFWVHPSHPYHEQNFYKWAKENCNITKKYVGTGVQVNDYSDITSAMEECTKFFIHVSQIEAGFKTKIEENIIKVEMPPTIKGLINRLRKDKIIKGEKEIVLADTGVKLQSKIHQLCSGTVKFESGANMVISDFKAEAIKNKFKNEKLVIFYLYTAELDAICQVFGTDVSGTKATKHIALQLQSGARAITLKEYDAIVYYNIGFSCELYSQSRDRMSFKEREKNNVYFVFSKGGIEEKIYRTVQEKRDYSLKEFSKDYEVSK
jgi:hypothetical protein